MENRRRLFIAGCVALVAMAVAFSVCTDIMGDFERVFKLKKGDVGAAVGTLQIGQTAAIFIGGAVLDLIGMSTALWLAFAAHLIGVSTVICAQGFWSLLLGWTFIGLAAGLIEASINPLTATMYPDKKTHMLNMLHAWWPGGLVIGGLAGYGLTRALQTTGASGRLTEMSWQIKMALTYVPILLYGALIFRQKFPKTERVQAGVSTRAMFREACRPLFLLLVFCMFLTASTELGPARWVGVFVQDIIGIRGILFLVYTSGLMFILRHFAGPLAHRLSPIGLMMASSILSGIGLLALSYSETRGMVFLAATAFGIGVAYFWPTMLGITSERFPKGGALLLGLIGGAGCLFIGEVTIPGMGALHDHYTVRDLSPELKGKVLVGGRVDEQKEASLAKEEVQSIEQARKTAAGTTFRWVATLPVVLTIVFGAIFLYDRRRGGYRAEVLAGGGGEQDNSR